MPHRMNRSLLILALIGVVLYAAVLLVQTATDTSMEEETTRPKVSKEQAAAVARALIAERDPSFAVNQDAAVLHQSDKELSGYLQKYKLNASYQETYGARYPIDYWQVAIGGGGAAPKYVVSVRMDNPEAIGWMRYGAAASGQTTEAKRKELAEGALRSAGYEPADFVLKPAEGTGLRYVYESRKDRIGDAVLQVKIGLSGTQITGLSPVFQEPESFRVWLAQEEKAAQRMSLISPGLTLLMGLAALILAIIHRREITFSRGLLLTLIFAGLYALHAANSLPGALTDLEPDQLSGTLDPGIYLTLTYVLIAIMAIAMYLSLVTGDQMWRARGWNAWPSMREPSFGEEMFYGMGRGYLICLFILGVQQVLFYIAGEAFDSFAITDPTQSTLNLYRPWLFPLLAWMAGISEEVTYRLFGIAFFRKIVRFRFLAVLVPSIIWALGHTGYTIYPSYTRLFEVTILGLIFGYVFLKYGLITAIYAHATMDIILMSLSLMVTEPTPGYIVLGLLYIAMPALIGYAARAYFSRTRQVRWPA
ncbi:hypothetical protein J31TS4_39900 [Paenibacillus sp. J31TS4]|uniref:CPBP family intramembrane glutamic endopeptidase n=1 Tax=Paenibacillus sp. J31TS4 TaxID=2807195 RepID=UPI001B0A9342|nr:type II CAAX endopeptidase family protein [Paenibacillus sp. J31TS4]GIP40710.1 hypothetical protein J31TS4_39900 [Paenibacillus sp. J31TS4]